MLKTNPWLIFTFGLIVGVVMLGVAQNQTIFELQKTVQDYKSQVSSLEAENASQSAQIIMLTFQPTPTPQVKYATPAVQLPYWCDTVINALMNDGFSRAVTNQLLKKDNPECTY